MTHKKKLFLTLGSDPELFVFDHKEGRIINALTVLKKDKHDPIDLGSKKKLYADNVLAEAAFPPSFTATAATMMMKDVLKASHEFLGERYSLLPIASHVMQDLPEKPSDELVKKWLEDKTGGIKIAPEWQIGCNPNFDVYAGEFGDARPQTPFKDGLRTGSFHIHIGNADMDDMDECRLLTASSKVTAVKLMDIFVGLSEVIFNNDSSSLKRRELYGRAGEHRPTSYGIEYRVLSNYALRSPKLTQLVFELTEYAMSMFDHDNLAEECVDMHNMLEVQRAINTQDKTLATAILGESWLPAKMFDRVNRGHNTTAFSTAKEWGI